MASSKIEELINEIEELVEKCKPVPFSPNKIAVPKEQIEELLRELRLKVPNEVVKYKKMLSNKDSIISDAMVQAESIVNAAKEHTRELVSEHEIMQKAYSEAEEIRENAYVQAQDILDRATEEANQMRYSAVQYTDDMLTNLQYIIEHSIESNRAKYDNLMSALDKELNVVISNRRELAGINEYEEENEPAPVSTGEEYNEYSESQAAYTSDEPNEI